MLTVGLSGYDGGKMAHMEAADYCLVAPSDHIPRIQEGQATVYHALLEVVQAELSKGTVIGDSDQLKNHPLQTGVAS